MDNWHRTISGLSESDSLATVELLGQERNMLPETSFYTVSFFLDVFGEYCFGVKQGKHLVAAVLACSYPHKNSIYIYLFIVQPKYRRTGLGTFLFEFVENKYRDLGYSRLIIRVLKKNQVAVLFWMRQGFKKRQHDTLAAGTEFEEEYFEKILI